MDIKTYLRQFARTQREGYKYWVFENNGPAIAIFKTINEARAFAIRQPGRFYHINTDKKILGDIDNGSGCYGTKDGRTIYVSPSYKPRDKRGVVYKVKKDGSVVRIDLGW